ncbi:hypothetical protein GCM10011608_33480 [Micromonospora sonchi]|uniref:Uncharacterized protein n=1 Tax=Micromonospora sonchi TaxID=1763543 RepID=A0A917TYZ0_9ACTN|nr:hypothetical protein [Micromonospora sonchi]GGM46024.1 hypothetical protein GCM10011608_33480 [Micromonospora sonchi]
MEDGSKGKGDVPGRVDESRGQRLVRHMRGLGGGVTQTEHMSTDALMELLRDERCRC